MAEKAGKIETIDNKLNPLADNGPATSLNTRVRTPQKPVSNVRGQGGITKEMNGVKHREVRGSEFHEHVQEGRSMNAILQPDSIAQTRRAMTPSQSTFIRSSNAIGSSQMYNHKEAQDPADLLKPSRTFRKASEASMGNRLWTNENEFGMFDDNPKTKAEVSKS